MPAREPAELAIDSEKRWFGSVKLWGDPVQRAIEPGNRFPGSRQAGSSTGSRSAAV
jgi:hypothetical protein